MPDLQPVLTLLVTSYAAASAGLMAALVLRAGSRLLGGFPSGTEATWCAFLPFAALVLLPALSAFQEPGAGALAGLHAAWHRLEAQVHQSPAGHGALHLANGLTLLLAFACLARTVYTLARMRTFAAALRTASEPLEERVGARPVLQLASERPICFTLGVFQPSVYITSRLLENLAPRDREAMLAHEAAHIRRRDGLVSALLTLFYTAFPLPGSRLLYEDWERAAERECDAAAARRIGSPHDVAAALVRVARLAVQPAAALPYGACFIARNQSIEARVEALLAVPAPGASSLMTCPGRPFLVVLASLGILFTAHFWVHHVVDLFVHH